MSFSQLPEDACFHLLMNEHPKDLYQVSHHIPQLNRLVHQGKFQRFYQEKWLDILDASPQYDLITQAGYVVLRRKSHLMALWKEKEKDYPRLLTFLLDQCDQGSFIWFLLNFNTIIWITKEHWRHAQMTPDIRRVIFDLGLFDLNNFLCLDDNYRQMEDYIYWYDQDYTLIFEKLIRLDAQTEFARCLTRRIQVNPHRLLRYSITSGHLHFIKLCVERLEFTGFDLYRAIDQAENMQKTEIATYLRTKINPDNIYVLNGLVLGHNFVLNENNVCIGYLTKEKNILPLTVDQEEKAAELGFKGK